MHEGHRERMRGKMFSHGDSLTDCELLEFILFDAIERKNTNPIAHALLDCFGDLAGVFSATPRLLCTVAGIGPHAAEYLYSYGLALKRIAASPRSPVRLFNYAEVSKYISARFRGCASEKLELYFTDKNGLLLCTKTISDVRKDSVLLDSKTFGTILTEVKPENVLVAHNHPSGSAEPSAGDDGSLAELVKMCRMHGVRLCDSVIYADGKLYSYYHSGRFKELRLD